MTGASCIEIVRCRSSPPNPTADSSIATDHGMHACMHVKWVMRSWATLLMPEEQAARVRARLQPPSMSMRSCGHASAMADRAVEHSFVQLCRLKTCRTKTCWCLCAP